MFIHLQNSHTPVLLQKRKGLGTFRFRSIPADRSGVGERGVDGVEGGVAFMLGTSETDEALILPLTENCSASF